MKAFPKITRGKMASFGLVVAGLVALASHDLQGAGGELEKAKQIMAASSVKGGLIVHVGAGDGALTAALRGSESFVVQGLERDGAKIAAARQRLQSAGLYGKISVAPWSGGTELPYAENLVNLVVVSGELTVAKEELLRVLAPKGQVFLASAPQAAYLTKPWPKEIDEWTHRLHDAGGNAVAHDQVVAPPRQFQWTADPRWSRSHAWTPSTSAMVSAQGRLFYINDEAIAGVDESVPDKWMLVGRDAFSGVALWKVPVPNWGSRFLSGTPDHGGRFTMPPQVGKRLVAVGDTVYVTLGATAPVSAIDAATGAVRQVFPETENADEILVVEGKLIAAINSRRVGDMREAQKQVCAVDLATGRLLWKEGPFNSIVATRQQDPFGRLELVAGEGQVFLLTETEAVCLDMTSGKTNWKIARPELSPTANRDIYAGFGIYEYRLSVLVYHQGVLLLAQPEPRVAHTYHTVPGSLYGFDAKTGRQLWKRPYGAWGHDTPPDVFVVNGVVWTHVNAPAVFPTTGKAVTPLNMDKIDYQAQGLDLKTGETRQQFSTKEIFDVEHHHRCYRNKITDRFLMSSRRGVEFVDLQSGANDLNHWVRSGCLLGNLPCNGLLYVAPHDCGCYMETKLSGFNALAPQAAKPRREIANDQRLEKGPAFGEAANLKPEPGQGEDWPTYRHDGQRSGATEAKIGAALAPAWEVKIGGQPGGIVSAGGSVFVAEADTHAVHALEARDGKRRWTFVADARVDSPPTIFQGLALFGSADGHVYCLRAADGAVVWRFNAAPENRQIMARDQLESAWPICGSVLVHDGKAWFAAGRSSYVDGGVRWYALEPATGKVVKQQTIYSPDPVTGKMEKSDSKNYISGVLNDVLSTDGTAVYLRETDLLNVDQRTGRPHLRSSGGYLDSAWFNRTFWRFGGAETTGVMVNGQGVVYGVEIYPSKSRETVFKPGAQGYRLMCMSLNKTGIAEALKPNKKKKNAPAGGEGWEKQVPIRITAMVRAGETLLVCGPPDVVDAKDPHGSWEGRLGGVLAAFATKDGRPLFQLKLGAPPTWDGMAVANGQVFVSTMDGKVVCLR